MANRLSQTLSSICDGIVVVVGTASGLAAGAGIAFLIWNIA